MMKLLLKYKYKLKNLKQIIYNIYFLLQQYDFFQDVINIVRNTDNFDYINGNYNVCPFCGGDNIQTDDHNWEDNLYIRSFDCDDCDKRWDETYMLVSMTETY